MRLSAVSREDITMEAKESCLPSAENSPNPRTVAPSRQSLRCWRVAAWLNRLKGEFRIPVYILLVWFVSFSSLYYWDSELHFMLVVRWILLIFPQDKLTREAHKCVWVWEHDGACGLWMCPCVSVRETETKNLPNFRNTLMCSCCLLSVCIKGPLND